MDVAALRAEFPVLERFAFLNAGTDGPVPVAAVRAAREALESRARRRAASAALRARLALQGELRALYAACSGCAVEDLALTDVDERGPRDGARRDRARAGRRDPDLRQRASRPDRAAGRGPRRAARRCGPCRCATRRRRRCAHDARRLLARLLGHRRVRSRRAGGPRRAGRARRRAGRRRGAGRRRALGCAAYAASGQKWLCGSDGTGMLYVAPAFASACARSRPQLHVVRGHRARPRGALHSDARRYDTPSLSREALAFSLAATRVLEAAGFDAVHARAAEFAARLADALAERGTRWRRAVRPRSSPGSRRPARRARAARRRGRDRARPARHALPARLGRRVERRERPRAARVSPAQRPGDPLQPDLLDSIRCGVHRGRRRRRLEPRPLLRRQLDVDAPEHVLEMLRRPRARDRRRHALHPEQPGERDLRHGGAVRRRRSPRRRRRPGSCARSRAGARPPPVVAGLPCPAALGQRLAAAVAAAQEAGAERAPREHAEAGGAGERAAARSRPSARPASTAAAGSRTATSRCGPAGRPPTRAARPGSWRRRARGPCRRARGRPAPPVSPPAAPPDRARAPGRGRSRRSRGAAGWRRRRRGCGRARGPRRPGRRRAKRTLVATTTSSRCRASHGASTRSDLPSP